MSRPEALNVVAAVHEALNTCQRLDLLAWNHAVAQHHPNGSPKKQGATLRAIRWRPTEGQKEEARYAAALLLRVANDDAQDFNTGPTFKATPRVVVSCEDCTRGCAKCDL